MNNTDAVILSVVITAILAGLLLYFLATTPNDDSVASTCRTQGYSPLVSDEGVACMDSDNIQWLYCYGGDESAMTIDWDVCYDKLFNQ